MNKQAGQHDKQLNRRSFLKRAWAWLGVAAGIEFVAVASSFVATGKKKKAAIQPKKILVAGTAERIAPGSVIPFKNGKCYLIRMEDGGFMALSLTCTHLGCAINFDGTRREFICPCHSSIFDLRGNVLKPPAPRALDAYRVFIEGGMVKIDASRKIRRKSFQPRDLVYV